MSLSPLVSRTACSGSGSSRSRANVSANRLRERSQALRLAAHESEGRQSEQEREPRADHGAARHPPGAPDQTGRSHGQPRNQDDERGQVVTIDRPEVAVREIEIDHGTRSRAEKEDEEAEGEARLPSREP